MIQHTQMTGRAKRLTMKIIETQIEDTATTFQNYYLDWLNDFLTLEGYARFYNITKEAAEKRINIGRKIHKQRTEGK